MKNSEILLKKRITLLVLAFLDTVKDFWSGEYFKKILDHHEDYSRTYAAWPVGELILLKDKLVLKALWEKWELPFNQIDYIQKNNLIIYTGRARETLRKGMIISHRSKHIPKFVYINGFWGYKLFELLKKISLENKLNLKFKE